LENEEKFEHVRKSHKVCRICLPRIGVS